MVSNNTDGYIRFIVLAILCICQTAYMLPQFLNRVYIKHGFYILDDAGQTLQAHAGIDIFLLQFGIVVIAVIIKLGKYVIPDLHVPVAVAAYGTIRFAAPKLRPSVIVNFRAGTAGAASVLPEIVLFSKTEDALRRDADVFIPDLPRFIIIQVNRRIESVRIKAYYLGQELPGPADGFFLEIVAKRKVSQHFKKCTVTGCLSYIFNISGTDTFLAGSHTLAGRDLLSGKIRLKRRHAGIDEQKALIIMRYQ